MSTVQTARWDLGFDSKSITDARPDGSIRIAGYLSDFQPDLVDDYFDARALEDGLKGWLEAGGPILVNHSYAHPIGRCTAARVDAKGLYIEGELPPPEPGTYAAQFMRLIRAGAVKSLSIGGRWVRERVGSLNRIVRAQILEASVCVRGVNLRTGFEIVAGGKMISGPLEGPGDRLSELRRNRDALRRASHAADIASLRLDVLAMRERRRRAS